jgi:hypothetical protein
MKALVLATVIFAQAPAETTAPALTDAEAYTRDVVLSTFYHEMAHALMDVLDAPVLGLEEDAADILSALLIDHYWEPGWDAEKAWVASDYLAKIAPSWAEGEPAEIETWHTHSPVERRYFTYVCLFYGADPDARESFANYMGLPVDRRETCPWEYALAAESWDKILQPVAGSGKSLTFEERTKGYDYVADALRDEIAYMNEQMLLPRTVSVLLTSCGEANSFYDPVPVTVRICTEMIDDILRLAKKNGH